MKSIQRLCKEGSVGILLATFAAAIAVGTATAVAWPAIFGNHPAPAATVVVTDSKKATEREVNSKGGTVLLHAGISGNVEAADYAQTHQWLR
jgi:hypothetical protein